MNPPALKLLRLRAEALTPSRQTAAAAGYDLHACLDAPLTLETGERRLIPTGWAMAIPEGFEGQIRPRSGLALKHGITVLNAPGTIDSDYRGEVAVLLINHGQLPYTIHPGDRVAQLILAACAALPLELVEALPVTHRAEGGFGHTGR